MNFENMTKEDLIEYINKMNEEQTGKFGLVWDKEKEPETIVTECDKKIPVLKEIKNKDIADSASNINNILIEGDNFHSLNVLNYTHKEAVDVIYIDPPYNTGNDDFMYNDKFVNTEDGYRHSKWLNFMSKRLKLAKNLLKHDGMIFISIDDNEYAQLKLLCDNIFGENNFLSVQHIQVRYGNKSLNEKNDWQPIMEYVLIYARNKTLFKANKPFDDYSTEKFVYEIKELKPGTNFEVGDRKVTVFKKDEFEIVEHDQSSLSLLKATWVTGSIYSGTGHGKTFQKVVEPRINIDGLGCIYKVYGLGDDGLGYRYFSGPTKPTSKFGKMYTGIPTTRLEEINNGEAIKYRPIINYYDFSPDFGNIRSEGGIAFNSGKKPIKMLKQFINYHPNKNAVVLDFFAGSGSTGHAVLDLNKEDNGNRKFILCTNNENNICDDITYPRLKNIIEGYSTKEALGGNLQYYKTDFVDNIGTRDQLYYDLTEKCIPMLCVKESTFDKVEVTKEYAIYSNKDQTKFTGVYFDIFGQKYNDFLEKISGIKQHKELYIFSLGNEVNVDDLSKINDYNIEAIPYKILDLYKRIVKMSKED